MAYKIGSHANNLVIPNMSANTYGSELHAGDGATRDGYWAYPGGPYTAAASGWRYRSIYTHGYMAAGYKGSNAWRTTNKTWHQTDTTLYCGEQLDREGSYLDGNFRCGWEYLGAILGVGEDIWVAVLGAGGEIAR